MPKNQGLQVNIEPVYDAHKGPIRRTFIFFFHKFGFLIWKGKVRLASKCTKCNLYVTSLKNFSSVV